MEKLDRAIRKFKLNVIKIENVPESYSSEVFNLTLGNGEKVIIKIPYNKQKLIREFKMLERLKGRLPVPGVLDLWNGDDEIPGALLLSWLPGEPITGEINKKMSYGMGELLAKLHENPMPGFGHDSMDGFVFLGENNWWKYMNRRFDNLISECRGAVDCSLLIMAQDYFDDFYRDLPEPDGPRATHMDFRPGNVLAKGSEITGIIDFESAIGGSADVDFTKIKLYVWDIYPETKKAFEEGYRSIRPLPDLEKVLPFNLFFNALAGVAWCIVRGKKYDDFYMENMKLLKSIIQ